MHQCAELLKAETLKPKNGKLNNLAVKEVTCRKGAAPGSAVEVFSDVTSPTSSKHDNIFRTDIFKT